MTTTDATEDAGAALARLLGLTGWICGEPPGGRPAGDVEADHDCADTARCRSCRSKGLTLLPFHDGPLVRCFLLCGMCRALFSLAD